MINKLRAKIHFLAVGTLYSMALLPGSILAHLFSILLNWAMIKTSHQKVIFFLILAISAVLYSFQDNLNVFDNILILLLSTFGLLQLNTQNLIKLVRMLLVILSFGGILNFIALLYTIFGGDPIFTIINETEFSNSRKFFLTAFSNTHYNFGTFSIIKPSFIFDEPGKYSFVVSTIFFSWLLLRETQKHIYHSTADFRLNDSVILFIAVGLLSTLSLHGILTGISIVFFLKSNNLKHIIVTSAIVIMFTFEPVYNLTVGRIFSDTITFNNRSILMENGFNTLSRNDFHFFGLYSTCDGLVANCNRMYGTFSDTPLTPLLGYGVLSILYYIPLATIMTGSFIALNKRLLVFLPAFCSAFLLRSSFLSMPDIYLSAFLLINMIYVLNYTYKNIARVP